MTESPSAEIEEFEMADGPQGASGPVALVVDVEGYEGPLDVLLVLARSQKVDLKKISILALVDQYLAFIARAKKENLELAADYLVMAAWLAYLKSRLLLPKVEEDSNEPSGEELAARLAFQLQRLQAMRDAGAQLMARDRLGRDVFPRGMPEGIRVVSKPVYEASLFDLLKAYSEQRVRTISHQDLRIKRAPVFAIEDARHRIERLFGRIQDWHSIDNLLPEGWMTQVGESSSLSERRRSARASTFAASLELAKDGHLDIRQLAPFGPIYVRRRASEPVNKGPVSEGGSGWTEATPT